MDGEIQKKIYELGYLVINPDDEPKILDLVKKSGGEVIDQRGITQVKLAYPIQKHESAHFGTCYFEADIPALEKINASLKSDLEILRFLIISRLAKSPQVEKDKSKDVQKPRTTQPQPQPAAAVTNEALEEKLEEILK